MNLRQISPRAFFNLRLSGVSLWIKLARNGEPNCAVAAIQMQ